MASILDYGSNILNWLDKAGNVWDKFSGNSVVNDLAKYYTANQGNDRSNEAIANAMNAMKYGIDQSNATARDYRTNTLNTAKGVYDTAGTVTQPYRTAGEDALAGYMRLLQNPNDLKDNAQYNWSFDQGEEALSRKLNSRGQRLSGNENIALTEYGQGFANTFMNDYLSRYLPMVEAGQNAAGQYLGAGENYADRTLKTDILTSDRISENNLWYGNIVAAGAQGQSKNDNERDAELFDVLFGNTETKTNTETGSNAGSLVGAAKGAYDLVNGGSGSIGSVLSSLGAGGAAAGGAETFGVGAGTVSGVTGATPIGGSAVSGAVGFNPASWGAAGILAPLAVPFIGKFVNDLIQSSKGGSVEEAKSPKLAAQLQRDMQADPSGKTAQATIASLINGGLWGGESNGWVIDELLNQGMLNISSPVLYGKSSVVDLTSAGTMAGDKGGSHVFSKLAGMTPAEAQTLRAASRPSSRGSGDYAESSAKARSDAVRQQIVDNLLAKYKPIAIQNAVKIRAQILAQNPSADVTQLTKFIGG